ncbi:MAG: S-adenosylmethionine:tRNA ribosyltransferase-isomerase [Nocardioidaceae bacterium]|nr:S-adenosylmethionine:tRNA ribosyltransferase-isomerase [Nocardioidaceae bacterium]
MTRFTLPPGSEATAPPERRGLARDAVRLLVARPGDVHHAVFRDLADHLEPGDLVVVNTSATRPAALEGQRLDGRRTPVHVATATDDGSWVVEVRRADNSGPETDVREGERIQLAGGVSLLVESSFPRGGALGSRLWRTRPKPELPLTSFLHDHGRPIRYGYLSEKWPLGDLQTVYADEPGSAEMPSAGRPFSHRLLVRLISKEVAVAPIVLHAGVSSQEKHEPPMPERYRVPEATARLVSSTRQAGRRVVAVGTTVVRALESATTTDGEVTAATDWTDLVLGPDRPARAVTGLVTGLHEPEASHLLLLEAVAGADLVRRAYAEAVAQRYLWHEFGDSMLFLP